MDALQRIDALVKSNAIVLFLKGDCRRPTSRQSDLAVRILDDCGCNYLPVNIQDDPVIRANLPKYKGCATFPQLYVQGQLIGGTDVMQELYDNSELCPMLQAVCKRMRVAV